MVMRMRSARSLVAVAFLVILVSQCGCKPSKGKRATVAKKHSYDPTVNSYDAITAPKVPASEIRRFKESFLYTVAGVPVKAFMLSYLEPLPGLSPEWTEVRKSHLQMINKYMAAKTPVAYAVATMYRIFSASLDQRHGVSEYLAYQFSRFRRIPFVDKKARDIWKAHPEVKALVEDEGFGMVTRPCYTTFTYDKLLHDMQQLQYLLKEKKIPASYKAEVKRYKQFIKLTADVHKYSADTWTEGVTTFKIPTEHFHLIRDSYNRMNYFPVVPRVKAAINPNLDFVGLTRKYYEQKPGFLFFDNLLTPEALEGLHRFNTEATVFFEPRMGYLGAYKDDGFYSELYCQVLEEFRLKFPQIFFDLPVKYAWIYKHAENIAPGKGVRLHADDGTVNVNFWTTPDTANLDPESGGLVVYLKSVPLDWGFAEFQNPDLLAKYIEENQIEEVVVPYLQNRVVLFNSNLIHKTGDVKFRKGLANRRANLTAMFGERVPDADHEKFAESFYKKYDH